jgi:hypothetical protein
MVGASNITKPLPVSLQARTRPALWGDQANQLLRQPCARGDRSDPLAKQAGVTFGFRGEDERDGRWP